MNSIKFLMFPMFFLSCESQKEKVIKNQWKYQDGYHIGDVIHFGAARYFSIDDSCKIYRNGDYVAFVKSVNNKTLKLISAKGNEVGFYVYFGTSKRTM